MNVLLLNLPWTDGARSGVRAGSRWPHLKHAPEDRYLPFPFFLAYATSVLKKNQINAHLIDAIAEQLSDEETRVRIKEYNPTHLVIETSFVTLAQDLKFLELLSKQYVIILVGPSTEIASQTFLDTHPNIHTTISGEYEYALLTVLQSSTQTRRAITSHELCNLDDLPWPERDTVPMTHYHDTPGGIPEPSAQMLASRGCPFGCSFCLWPAVMYGGKNYRTRNHIDVIDEMETLEQRGFKSIYFDDDTFGLDRSWVLRFCDELILRRTTGRITIPWAMMTRADHMDRALLIRMKEAGLAAVKYGVESSSPNILAHAHKQYNLATFERMLSYTKALEIKIHLTFAFGLPEETHDSARDTILYALHLNADSAQFSIATPFPGTPYHDQMTKNNALTSSDPSLYDGNYHAVIHTDSLSPTDIVYYKNLACHIWNVFIQSKRLGRVGVLLCKTYTYARLFGIAKMLSHTYTHIHYLFSLKKRLRDRLRYFGFFHGSRAFVGPSIVQVDLTNQCNNDCIACWCNSPLLGDAGLSDEEKQEHLSLTTVRQLIDDLHALGTHEIFLSGGGEPFMHPHIMEIISYIKSKDMVVHINTNFTLVTKETIDQILSLGADHLTISVWAGTPEVYAATHPNKSGQTFTEIEQHLQYLQRNRHPDSAPTIKLYNVLSTRNYQDFNAMYAFADRIDADMVEFALLDPIPGKTDTLMLNDAQIAELLANAQQLHDRLLHKKYPKLSQARVVQFDQFIRRLARENAAAGDYDKTIIDSLPCYTGWVFSRVLPNGNVNACLKAHQIPIGNINTTRFIELWNSQKQRTFRKETAVLKKSSPFFSSIGNNPSAECGCHKGCDDLGRNLLFHKALHSVSFAEKFLLRAAATLTRLIHHR